MIDCILVTTEDDYLAMRREWLSAGDLMVMKHISRRQASRIIKQVPEDLRMRLYGLRPDWRAGNLAEIHGCTIQDFSRKWPSDAGGDHHRGRKWHRTPLRCPLAGR